MDIAIKKWACLISAAAILPFTATADNGDGRPDLEGVWKTTYVSLDDPRWRIEDLACRGRCTLEQFEFLQALLADPANDKRSVKELYYEAEAHNGDYVMGLLTPAARARVATYDPATGAALDCSPEGDGWHHQITAPPPIRIEQFDDRVIIRYEYWNAVRTVYMDGREHPYVEPASRLGHSIGWYDGPTLVIETRRLKPGGMNLPREGGIQLSDDMVAMERYTRSEDGQRLDLVWSIIDPTSFTEPLKGQKSSLIAPDWELDEFVCEAITGEY